MTNDQQQRIDAAYTFSVWCGGSEINDHYLNRQQADELAEIYTAAGYDDVHVVNYRHVGGL